MELTTPTKLEYYDQMSKLQSKTTLLSYFKGDDGREALILDSTIFHPQGGGQPSDTGFITIANSNHRFCVQDVRSKDGVVFHYGVAEDSSKESELEQGKGKEVSLQVDESRRRLNSRRNVGLGHLEPGKGYHFPDGPFVEYKGTIPPNELQSKQRELEMEVNALISKGGKVYATVLPYEEAAELCGGSLPDYIPQGSNPRIIKIGDNPGCPCGGTHVSDISEITSLKVSQIRTKKGMTKVFYTIGT
ncbi:Alanine-tRNA ligases,nucleic acid binding,ligases, forming aminoacyl-tRNA and related compounds,nucleotide binding,ATP binding isoform 5 [Theobroma cacao]|uniref:Alanine-tRNA ligases,nucleic acid binding,ligases, forming aminoacyl-tRNA and related compounds,nucleotide binding,ATP binding isoform 5 n=1 Tax=Theobroma cacao TaxID=3641 RepID=A0A061EW54_THECC|nr:Alanine-tRNA ligases,nucleic acid binding,ligases, forming aminoacyl-tRNA and related compounds,nucleotide binding,ATP binding isoform 5 [Theobroma cacao]